MARQRGDAAGCPGTSRRCARWRIAWSRASTKQIAVVEWVELFEQAVAGGSRRGQRVASRESRRRASRVGGGWNVRQVDEIATHRKGRAPVAIVSDPSTCIIAPGHPSLTRTDHVPAVDLGWPSPKCLQDAGRKRWTRENSCQQSSGAEMPVTAPLRPEVARRHSVRKTPFVEFESLSLRQPSLTLPNVGVSCCWQATPGCPPQRHARRWTTKPCPHDTNLLREATLRESAETPIAGRTSPRCAPAPRPQRSKSDSAALPRHARR